MFSLTSGLLSALHCSIAIAAVVVVRCGRQGLGEIRCRHQILNPLSSNAWEEPGGKLKPRWPTALLAMLLLASQPSVVLGQFPGQLRYTYDAAGNVVGIDRITKPDLTVSNLVLRQLGSLPTGAYSISVTFQVNNSGNTVATGTWTDRGYLSSNAVFEDSNEVLAGYTTRSTTLAAGGSYQVSATFTTGPATAPGTYTLFVKADGGGGAGQFAPTGANNVDEWLESNNTQSVTVVLPAKTADLAISGVSVGGISVNQVGALSIPVTFTVTNVGSDTAPANLCTVATLSSNAVLENSDTGLSGYYQRATTMAPGESFTVTQSFTTNVSQASGPYTMFVKTDGRGAGGLGGTLTDNGLLAESFEGNNVASLPVTLPVRADLTASNVSIGLISASQSGVYTVPITFTINNTGGLPALPNFYTSAYLSSDAVLDNADQMLVGSVLRNSVLNPAASYAVTQNFTTSATTTSGTYTLFVKADGRGPGVFGTITDNGYVGEANETNNTQTLSIALPAKADLAVSNLSVGTIVRNANGSKTLPITFTVTNLGALPALPTFYGAAFLSSDGVLDNADQALTGKDTRTTELAAGASYVITRSFVTNTTTPAGSYTLFVKADARGNSVGLGTNTDNGYLAEVNEANNVTSIPVVLP